MQYEPQRSPIQTSAATSTAVIVAAQVGNQKNSLNRRHNDRDDLLIVSERSHLTKNAAPGSKKNHDHHEAQAVLQPNHNKKSINNNTTKNDLLRVRPLLCKYIAVAGDTITQVFFTCFYFPLDAVPQFGASQSLAGSWTGFVDATHNIFNADPNNWNKYYCLLYIIGFWLSKVTCTYLNFYSPTLGSVRSAHTAIEHLFVVIVSVVECIWGSCVAAVCGGLFCVVAAVDVRVYCVVGARRAQRAA